MKKVLFITLCLYFFVPAIAQISDPGYLIEPINETIEQTSIFDDNEPFDLTLQYDITSFIKNKYKGEYLDAVLILHLNETDSIVKNIRLKARGNFRKGHCFFPPIYLNFKTDPIQNTDLEGIKKMKLVTHCSSSKVYEYYILKEYLAYRVYNELSENSFRVKLVNINYVDTGKKGRNYRKEGFLIEPLELLVKRTNSVEVDPKLVRGGDVKELDMDRVAIFEYFIGNTDWRVKGGHNMKYIKSMEEVTNKVIPVPYDFDYSGFVNASYAFPQEWTTIKNVTEREYLGYCRNSNENLLQVIDEFVQNKEEIYSLINGFQLLSDKERKQLQRFTKGFFDEAKNPKVLLGTVKNECRGIDF
ncbi:hypothetical protein [Maribellus sediminis]|uniref:hypothetical protein n=1 Tax=Maribellus sediminis TaxID=2696285 RepID=UPI00142F9C45|nr:hypothetical protein [Maribellus sediminis]